MCSDVKTFVKMLNFLFPMANLIHIPRVQKPGLRPTALALAYPRPGQKPAQAKGQARLFLAWPGPASGLRPKPAHHYCEYGGATAMSPSLMKFDLKLVLSASKEFLWAMRNTVWDGVFGT